MTRDRSRGVLRTIMLCSNDRDFVSIAPDHDHAGIFLYTDQVWVRKEPRNVLTTVELVVQEFGPEELSGEVVWFDHWRDATP